ncbi:hypothetical protein [Thermoflavimicrobium daqui]|uniref:hypothetical protein n=1 Tax=Thermoflavimicrobium daqui TaxID=2137476 RepID=UPI00143CD3C4|nr:hypothetical protein [Thermoflavimicrobium daqui]
MGKIINQAEEHQSQEILEQLLHIIDEDRTGYFASLIAEVLSYFASYPDAKKH